VVPDPPEPVGPVVSVVDPPVVAALDDVVGEPVPTVDWLPPAAPPAFLGAAGQSPGGSG
jgi:hypothetical protein